MDDLHATRVGPSSNVHRARTVCGLVRSSRFPILARLAPATAAALAALAAAPAVGHAASTFGSDLKSPTTIDDGCEGPGTCTRLLFSIDGKDVTSPIDGVVVHWSAVGKGAI